MGGRAPVTAVRDDADETGPLDGESLDRIRRRLHDTSLQALELIAGGVAGAPGSLEEARRIARRAADDLREWLDGIDDEPAGTLVEAVRQAVAAARETAPHRMSWSSGPTTRACPP
jgi:hypothetical protein